MEIGDEISPKEQPGGSMSSFIRDKIERHEISLKLSPQKYNRHVEGTKEFEEYTARRELKDKSKPSKLYLTEEETQDFIYRYAGTGQVKILNGIMYPDEFITADQIVGEYEEYGVYRPTSRVMIKYGKRNSHMFPVKNISDQDILEDDDD